MLDPAAAVRGGGVRLVGRDAECAGLDQLLAEVRSGQSRALLVDGDAGVGKTALLEYLAGRATAVGCRVLAAVGVQSEMELAFAGLHQLCWPLRDHLASIPRPQRDALSTAFGLTGGGEAPDRFLVGLAVLSLLAEAAADRPLVCVVDDEQWLDRASARALAFVAHRLGAESVGLVFGGRDVSAELEALPEMVVGGLDPEDARALLATVLEVPLTAAVADQIVAETGGNPLALLELPKGLTAGELATGFLATGAPRLSARVEESFRRRAEDLPPEARRLLLLAAAEPLGDPALLWKAAGRQGIGTTAAPPLEDAGLIDFGGRVRFRHPLVRSAVYQSASSDERRHVHAALAAVIDPALDPDRRAWHRALATSGPDEDVASELERSAGRAQATGGLAAAAAFLERSAELTLDSELRRTRTLVAAEAKHEAGATETALALVDRLEATPLNEVQQARVSMLRGRIAFGSSHGRDAPTLLLAAARQLEAYDPALARDTYLEALVSALFVGRLAGDVGVIEVAAAARTAPAGPGRPSDLLLDGFAALITEGYATGAPVLKKAVAAFRSDDLPVVDGVRWLWHATHAAHDLWDDQSWELLCSRHIELARQVGAVPLLPLALSARIGLHLFAGELASVSALVDEVALVNELIGSQLPPYGALALFAWQGREHEAAELIRKVTTDLAPRGEGMGLTLVEHAAAVLYNGLGRYDAACEAAQRGAAYPQELGFANWCLVQLVESAVRSGRRDLAQDALQRLAATTAPSGTDWARGIEARSRALVSDDDEAEPWYQEAIDRLGQTRVRGELARAHLLYGEWLRRDGRRADARGQLRTAHDMLTTMGMHGFAERARSELLAMGDAVRKRTVETTPGLTPQELQIARLAAEGRTNPQIGSQLFISKHTVEYHLRKVFTKLNVSSRNQLRKSLARSDSG